MVQIYNYSLHDEDEDEDEEKNTKKVDDDILSSLSNYTVMNNNPAFATSHYPQMMLQNMYNNGFYMGGGLPFVQYSSDPGSTYSFYPSGNMPPTMTNPQFSGKLYILTE